MRVSSVRPCPLLLFLCAILFLGILSVHAQSAEPPTDGLDVTNIIFFKSGVSYIRHSGRVNGSTTTTLNFQAEQMKDVLKSMVLQDPDGGTAGVISFPSQNPLARTMDSYRVDLREPTGLGRLRNQLRGTDVELSKGSEALCRTIVSAEQRSISGDDSTWHLNLYGTDGMVYVPMEAITSIEFADRAVQQELREALQAVSSIRDRGQKPVRIQLDGTGSRRVRVAHVVEAPIWKTSYRVVLPERNDTKGQLQGWVIVENQTDAPVERRQPDAGERASNFIHP